METIVEFRATAAPDKVQRLLNKTGGVYHRSFRAVHNGSFHDSSTTFVVVEQAGAFLDITELLRAMAKASDVDAETIHNTCEWR